VEPPLMGAARPMRGAAGVGASAAGLSLGLLRLPAIAPGKAAPPSALLRRACFHIEPAVLEGVLLKQASSGGGGSKRGRRTPSLGRAPSPGMEEQPGWQERYFVLSGLLLHYYRSAAEYSSSLTDSSGSVRPAGLYPLHDLVSAGVRERSVLVLQLSSGKTVSLRAPEAGSAMEATVMRWLKALQRKGVSVSAALPPSAASAPPPFSSMMPSSSPVLSHSRSSSAPKVPLSLHLYASALHVSFQSLAPPSTQATARHDGSATERDAAALYLTSNDMTAHGVDADGVGGDDAPVPGVSLGYDLSDGAVWTCRAATESDEQSPQHHAASEEQFEQAIQGIKVLQDNRGEFLCCAGQGTLYLSPHLCPDARWVVRAVPSSGSSSSAHTVQSAVHGQYYLSSEGEADGMRVHTLDLDTLSSEWSRAARAQLASASALRGSISLPSKPPEPPAPHVLAPACQWKLQPAVLQAPLLRRSNMAQVSPVEGGDGTVPTSLFRATSGGELESRFFWLSPSALCYWRTTLDALSSPPRRSYAYADMRRVLVAPDERNDVAEGRFLFRIDMLPLAQQQQQPAPEAEGEELTMCADSAWQRTMWLQALANKGVPVQMRQQ